MSSSSAVAVVAAPDRRRRVTGQARARRATGRSAGRATGHGRGASDRTRTGWSSRRRGPPSAPPAAGRSSSAPAPGGPSPADGIAELQHPGFHADHGRRLEHGSAWCGAAACTAASTSGQTRRTSVTSMVEAAVGEPRGGLGSAPAMRAGQQPVLDSPIDAVGRAAGGVAVVGRLGVGLGAGGADTADVGGVVSRPASADSADPPAPSGLADPSSTSDAPAARDSARPGWPERRGFGGVERLLGRWRGCRPAELRSAGRRSSARRPGSRPARRFRCRITSTRRRRSTAAALLPAR